MVWKKLFKRAQDPAAEAVTEISTGALIYNYRIQSKLGEGGFGAVYRAEHILLERPWR